MGEALFKRTDLLQEHAREVAGSPRSERYPDVEWRVYRYECFPKVAKRTLYYELTGSVAPDRPNGRIAWNKEDKATHRVVQFTPEEHGAWCAAWSKRTGLCNRCVGEGTVITGWSTTAGTSYAKCGTCGGSGKAAA